MAISEHLDFDVAGIGDRALQDYGGIAERALRLGARHYARIGNVAASATSRMPRPPPPATALIMTGKPISRPPDSMIGVTLVGALIAGHAGHTRGLHDVFAPGLVPIA